MLMDRSRWFLKKILMFPILLIVSFWSIQNHATAVTKSREAYEKTGNVVWEINTKEKLVAITFDDGPHPVFTPQILEILAKYNAKATFFVAGNKAERFPEVLKRVAKEGHEVGNHTYSHLITSKISAVKLTEELKRTDNIIQGITGNKPILYRPVAGIYNDVIINTAIKNGKFVILWSWDQDPRDWRNPPANQITRYVTKGINPGDIIVLHDWHGSEFSQACQTVLALDDILSYLSTKGYKSVTVSEMLYRSKTNYPEPFFPFH